MSHIFDELRREYDAAEQGVERVISRFTRPGVHTGHDTSSAPGALMSLSSIADTLDHDVAADIAALAAKVTAPVAELRQIATAVEQNPFTKAVVDVADKMEPELATAAANLVPLLSAAPVPVLQGLGTIIQTLTAVHNAATPAQ